MHNPFVKQKKIQNLDLVSKNEIKTFIKILIQNFIRYQ
jgi:hypothetical protein